MKNDIQKLFVPFAIAEAMKDKGFNERTIARLYKNNFAEASTNLYIDIKFFYDKPLNKSKHYVSPPTWDQAICWLREKHGIHVYVEQEWAGDVVVCYSGCIDYNDGGKSLNGSNDYYTALTAGIEEALKLIKP